MPVAASIDRGPEAETHLQSEPASAGLARRFVADALRSWQHRQHIQLVTMLTNELVTNAIVFSRGEIDVKIALRDGGIRVDVHDHSKVLPTRRPLSETDSGGRGLAIVDRMAQRWGVDVEPDGKVVWFEVSDVA